MRKILVLITMVVTIIMCCGCSNEFTESFNEPEGYAIIMREDGEQKIEFTYHNEGNGYITIHTTEGKCIMSNNITLFFY